MKIVFNIDIIISNFSVKIVLRVTDLEQCTGAPSKILHGIPVHRSFVKFRTTHSSGYIDAI